MATSYTALLGFALPVQGELNGTWGNTVNNSITQLCEDSIAGVATQSVLSADWTLTTAGSGAANQARMAILIPTGAPGVSRNIIAPAKSKIYTVVNQSNANVVIKGAATTGVTIAAGDKVTVVWNGSDFVSLLSTNIPGTFTNLTYTGTLTGSTGIMNIGSGQLYKDASGNVGIGLTPSGTYKLEVSGSIGSTSSTNPNFMAVSSSTTGIPNLNLQNATTNWQLRTEGSTGAFTVFNTSAERMRIDSAGNVGIGTTVPTANLHVASSAIAVIKASVTSSSGNVARFQLVSPVANYGLFVPDNSNYLSIYDYNASAERMRIDSTGNVGVGTSSPATYGKFAVQGVSGTPIINFYDGTITGTSGYTTGGVAYFGTRSNHPIGFLTNDIERTRIDSSGNVGIGTTSPGYKLHVRNDSASATNWITSQNGTAAGSFGSGFLGLIGTAGTNYFALYQTGNGDTTLSNYASTGVIVFGTNAGERMRIDSAGNVGIGTSSPSARLQVLSPGAWSAANWGKGFYVNTSGSACNPAIGISDATGSNNWAIVNVSGALTFNTGPAITDSTTAGVEHVRIHSSGGVSIGNTTDPGATNLSVAGTVTSPIIKSTTTGAPPQFNDNAGTQIGTLCRAWVNFNGVTTATIRASFNVSSVTRTAAGFYTVNFTTAMSDVNYAVNCSCNNTGYPAQTYTGTVTLNGSYAPTTTAAQVQFIGCQANNNVGAGSTGADISYVMVSVFR